jgi:phage/plasmid-associated DNA primase
MNEPPFFDGQEEITERVRIVSFERVTPGDYVDSRLKGFIESETDGIFTHFIVPYVSEMLALNTMPFGSVASQQRYEEFCKKTNPYGDFVKEYGRLGGQARVEPQHLLWAIGDYTERHDSTESLKRAFVTKLKQRYGITEKIQKRVGERRTNQRKWFHYGFELCGPLWEECKKRYNIK